MKGLSGLRGLFFLRSPAATEAFRMKTSEGVCRFLRRSLAVKALEAQICGGWFDRVGEGLGAGRGSARVRSFLEDEIRSLRCSVQANALLS